MKHKRPKKRSKKKRERKRDKRKNIEKTEHTKELFLVLSRLSFLFCPVCVFLSRYRPESQLQMSSTAGLTQSSDLSQFRGTELHRASFVSKADSSFESDFLAALNVTVAAQSSTAVFCLFWTFSTG